VESEVVEIEVPPVTGAVVHQADEDLLAHQALEFDDHGAEGLILGARDLKEGLACGRIHQFHPGLGPWATGDQEAGPRVSHLEGHRCERSLGVIAHTFKTTDPKVAFVIRLHIPTTLGHSVAADRQLVEGLTGSLPVAQVSCFKS
jgi:hypothetical protein